MHPVRAMTTANKVTILRVLLIPFFVVEMIYYVRTGNEDFQLADALTATYELTYVWDLMR